MPLSDMLILQKNKDNASLERQEKIILKFLT